MQDSFKFIKCLAFFIFNLLVLHIPDALSQDICPATIAGVKADSRFEKMDEYDIYSNISQSLPQYLNCEYYENGRLHREEPSLYKDGEILRHGLHKTYDEKGYLLSEITYEENQSVGVQKYYQSDLFGKERLTTEIEYSPNERIKRYYLSIPYSYKSGCPSRI